MSVIWFFTPKAFLQHPFFLSRKHTVSTFVQFFTNVSSNDSRSYSRQVTCLKHLTSAIFSFIFNLINKAFSSTPRLVASFPNISCKSVLACECVWQGLQQILVNSTLSRYFLIYGCTQSPLHILLWNLHFLFINHYQNYSQGASIRLIRLLLALYVPHRILAP